MSRKSVLTKEKIVKCAFELASQKGIANITIRNIAGGLQTSTAPIYTQYPNRETILDDLDDYITAQLYASMEVPRTSNAFFNMGIGIIDFSLKNRHLMSDFYFSLNRLDFDFTKDNDRFVEQMKTDSVLVLLGDERLLKLLEDMRVYAFGLVAIIITDICQTYDLDYYHRKLEEVGAKLIRYHLYESGKLTPSLEMIEHHQVKNHSFSKEMVLNEYDY